MAESRPSFATDHDACGIGFIAQLGGGASHAIVERGLRALVRLEHRGGVDADGRSGDGAGLLVQLPKPFFRKVADAEGIILPSDFGIGMVFLQRGQEEHALDAIRGAVGKFDLSFVGWREVPTDASILGPRSHDSLPVVRQCFLAPDGEGANGESFDFELQLYRLRQHLETIPDSGYYCSLSTKRIVYKGLLTPEQLAHFYLDLDDRDFSSSFVIFHQRYSTNTAPSWSLAQPFRFVAHNGEINTITGNRRWFEARSASLRGKLGLPAHARLLQPGMSDSASFDNALEAGVRSGRSMTEAAFRLMPPAWEHDEHCEPGLRQFLSRCAYEQEPWDGPAAMIFSDGQFVAAKLDRNGLRPLRYTLTSDGLLIVGSEVGIADLDNEHVIERHRLGPGQMLVVNPTNGAMVRPGEAPKLGVSRDIARSQPVSRIPSFTKASFWPNTSTKALAALGWSDDRYRILFQSLAESGQEAVWSMGDDAPPAFLSSLPLPLWDYCKQRFAQVTNPPIDPLRESEVMSLNVYLGDGRVLESPVLDRVQLEALNPKPSTTVSLSF